MFAYNSYYGRVVTAKNIKIVRDNETIQKVLDSITDASDSNRYMVFVPPGHENERFIYPHKKAQYVKLQYLANPEGKFQYELWDGCEDLTDWSASNATLELDETNATQGNYCIKVTASGSGNVKIKKDGEFDFSNYQGLMIDVKCKLYDIKSVYLHFFSVSNNWAKPYWYSYVVFLPADAPLEKGSELINLTLYFNFAKISETIGFDFANFKQLTLTFVPRLSRNISNVYVDNIRLIKTFPYPVFLFRTDDINSSIHSVIEKMNILGLRGCLNVTRMMENSGYTLPYLKRFYNEGWDIVNHSFSHFNFGNIDPDEALVRHEVLGMKRWLEENGFLRTLNLWCTPGHSINSNLVKLLYKEQILPVSGYINNILCLGAGGSDQHSFIGKNFNDNNSHSVILDSLNNFLSYNMHGIVTHLAHTRDDTNYTDEMLQEYLDFIQEHFVIMTYSDILKKIPFDFTKQQLAKHTGYKATLSGDFEYKYGDGEILALDAGGVDRNVTPTNEFPPFCKTTIINTGSTGNLIFDPSGLNLTIQPGQSANVIYDGDQWRQI